VSKKNNKMKKVSICFVVTGSYWESRFSFEAMGFEIREKQFEMIDSNRPKEYIKAIGNIEVELFVIDNTGDSRMLEYFEPLATNITTKICSARAELYNSFFKMATGDFICIIQSGVFFQYGWLVDLLYFSLNIEKSGVASIISCMSGFDIVPLPSKDQEVFINVLAPKDNCPKGVALFDRQLLYMVGAFDEDIKIAGNEISQFALRCIALGYNNYYINTQTCLFLNDKQNLNDENLKASLDEMKKGRNYYIPL
jgi:hypothetical protein